MQGEGAQITDDDTNAVSGNGGRMARDRTGGPSRTGWGVLERHARESGLCSVGHGYPS